jgi:hypothetical protein
MNSTCCGYGTYGKIEFRLRGLPSSLPRMERYVPQFLQNLLSSYSSMEWGRPHLVQMNLT